MCEILAVVSPKPSMYPIPRISAFSKAISLFPWLLFVVVLQGCTQNEVQRVSLQGKTMGTTYHISYLPSDLSPSPENVQAEIDARLVEVNQVASTYISDSELSLLNQYPADLVYPVSDDLRLLLKESINLAQLTGGALDVTVGPLVNLWGFGPDKKPVKAPSPELISETKQRTGIDKIQLTEQGVVKSRDDIYVDLSTIAKGFGVDEVADVLESHNIHNYLVEIGGELRVKGKKEQEQDWRVAIEKPVSMEQSVQKIIMPHDNAVATSGDYRNYYEFDGIRYSHIIEPDTGKPIAHKLVSVTVVHPLCMIADGLATGFMVLGSEKGMALANREGLAALFIEKMPDGSFKESYSNAMTPFLNLQ
nr:FAD:protein FMN transferase [Paraneptunicella aestuarii]